MRIVQSGKDFADSFLGAQREAAASFGVITILLEKYITQPRHIEVQVMAREIPYSVSFMKLWLWRLETQLVCTRSTKDMSKSLTSISTAMFCLSCTWIK